MSTAAISYDGLRRSVSEASDVAKKLDRYEGSLNSSVLRKLDSYSGDWTGNLSTVRNCVNRKISELQDDQNRFENYSRNLDNLKRQCETTERAVRSRISTLTNSFKEAYHVKVGYWEEKIGSFFTRLRNGSSFGKWIGEKYDDLRNFQRNIKSEIKQWFHFDGGKDFIKGCIKSLFEGLAAIAAIAAGIAALIAASTIGATIVAVAGIILGAIALVDAFVNLQGEISAVGMAGDDPATAKRRRSIDSLTEYLRSSFIFGKDGENYKYDKFLHGFADGINFVTTVCTVVSFIGCASDLLKNGVKWTTGSESLKKLWSKEGIKSFGKGLKGRFHEMLEGVRKGFNSIKVDGLKGIGRIAKSGLYDMGTNLKNNFLNFKTFEEGASLQDKAEVMEDMFKSLKNLYGAMGNLYGGDKPFVDGIHDILLPAVTIFGTGEDRAVLSDFKETFFDDSKDIYENISDVVKSRTSKSLKFDKFNSRSGADIQAYRIKMPDTQLYILRAA